MKFSTAILIVATTLTSLSANAKLTRVESANWAQRIAQACILNYDGPKKTNPSKTCSCVGTNYTTVSDKWSNRTQRLEILEYAEKFYGGKLSDNQIDDDPYMLFDIDVAISEGCIRDTNFKISE